jgi:hypothetical protein
MRVLIYTRNRPCVLEDELLSLLSHVSLIPSTSGRERDLQTHLTGYSKYPPHAQTTSALAMRFAGSYRSTVRLYVLMLLEDFTEWMNLAEKE